MIITSLTKREELAFHEKRIMTVEQPIVDWWLQNMKRVHKFVRNDFDSFVVLYYFAKLSSWIREQGVGWVLVGYPLLSDFTQLCII